MKKIITFAMVLLTVAMSAQVKQQNTMKKEAKKQTAGRDRLGDFAPKFAELNGDILFGQVWSREGELSPRDRSMVTIATLIGPRLKKCAETLRFFTFARLESRAHYLYVKGSRLFGKNKMSVGYI